MTGPTTYRFLTAASQSLGEELTINCKLTNYILSTMKNAMTKMAMAALVVCTAVALSGCQKAPALVLTGSPTVELSADGSSGAITFTANRDWTVSAADAWVKLSPLSGAASEAPVTVTVRCDANTTYEDRTSLVTIRMESLTQSVEVKQPANLGLIVPAGSAGVELPADAKTFEVEVQANVQYTVAVSVDWIKQTGTKALTPQTLTFSAEENPTYDERSAEITISGSGLTQSIAVKQAGKEKPKAPEGAVDLGLSVYWATCNLGATAPEESGDFYAWGEIKTKDEYTWDTYKWGNFKYDTITKYGPGDNRTVLEAEDDVAHVILGGNWRMPTDAEWTELLENCTWTHSTLNDINVRCATSNKNGISIFLPQPGFRADLGYNDGISGHYWSSSLSTDSPYDAWGVRFSYADEVSRDGLMRSSGFSVRPVCDKE